MTSTRVSVIIPTYNRQHYLRETLASLAAQSFPAACFEVIVVDDGSPNGQPQHTTGAYPFRLCLYRQTNQGDAAARNHGAQQSQADLLVFLDDDMLVAPDYLRCLVAAHDVQPNSIITGTAHLWLEESNPLDNPPAPPVADSVVPDSIVADSIVAIPFADVCSNNMSLSRATYFTIGPMTNLGFSGSSIWCDVDFAYRAHQQGFTCYRSTTALCWHRDYVAKTLSTRTKRARTAAYRAAVLFQRHPELLPYLPMFTDKTPIIWNQDPPRLIARKLLRHVASSQPSLQGMEQLAHLLEKNHLSAPLLDPLSRWIVGGHLFRGYREGLQTISGRDKPTG